MAKIVFSKLKNYVIIYYNFLTGGNFMREMELYQLWLANLADGSELKAELESINGDTEAIKDRFYRDLEFGTGGLRGVIGAGTNRMNIYTVKRATQGFADYLNQEYQNPSVAISYDSKVGYFFKGCRRGSRSKRHKGTYLYRTYAHTLSFLCRS